MQPMACGAANGGRSGSPRSSSVEEAAGDALVGVDAAIAEEGPVAAGVFEQFEVDLRGEDLFLVVAGLGDDAAEGVGDEAAAPELEAGGGGVVAGSAHFYAVVEDVAVLVADAVDGSGEDAVGDGVGALDGLPGGVLGFAVLGFFGRVPADGGGVEEGVGAHEGGDAGGFGVPLVPADQGSDVAVRGGEGFEAEVAGGEVELLVVEGV